MFVYLKKNSTFAVPKRDDSLAQQVEHNTFNVGVLGSSPRRITKKPLKKRLFLWSGYIRMLRVVRRRRHRRRQRRRHLSTNRGVFVDAECSEAAFVHKKGIFCGCGVFEGGICPQTGVFLWMQRENCNRLSTQRVPGVDEM